MLYQRLGGPGSWNLHSCMMTSSNGNIFRVTTGNLFLMRFKIQKHLFDNVQQSYKLTEQCENKSNISWWVHVWRPSLSMYFVFHAPLCIADKIPVWYHEVNGYLLLSWCRLYSEAMESRRLKSPTTQLFIQQLVPANKEESWKPCITGHLLREFTDHRCIPFSKSQKCGKRFHVMTS